jgi:hypothetical protein
VRGGLAQGILRERVGHCVVEIHCESLSMSYSVCLRTEFITSATITLLVEHGQIREHRRGNSNTIAKRFSSGHQQHGASRIVLRSCYPRQRFQARCAVARITNQV